MRVAFFGTPEVAVPALDALSESAHEVVCVVTQPDRVRGRGREVSASPVKERAEALGLPVLQPGSPKDEGFAESLRAFAPEALVVVAYGHILPVAVLEVAPAVNAHFSLLPAYRGAAPVQRALMDGATETGVTVFLLEPSVDSGPVLQVESTPVADDEDAGTLLARLAPIGARLLLAALEDVAAGRKGVAQDPALATPAPKIAPSEQRIDWKEPAVAVMNRVRGLSPKPGAWTSFRGKRLGLRCVRLSDAAVPPVTAGTIVALDPLLVATPEGALVLEEVQPEGKRLMSGEDFVRGYRPKLGERLGDP